jgi:hypothetical protein
MNGLIFGFVVGGVALVAGLIWAVVDNLFVYKRKPDEDLPEPPDGDQTRTPTGP